MENGVLHGENSPYLREFPDAFFDMIYCDPPFYSQNNFNDFDDHWETLDDYLDYIRVRLHECYRVLKPPRPKGRRLLSQFVKRKKIYLRVLCVW